jgi:hypothetical protein
LRRCDITDGNPLVIKINDRTRKKLESLGEFGQSWNELLNEMADFVLEHEDEWWGNDEEEG